MKIVGLVLSLNGSGCVKFELDKNLDIINQEYLAFTQVKKNSTKDILYFSKKQFKNDFEQNKWTRDNILSFCKDSEYCAIEDYAFGAKGRVFHIGEGIGLFKISLYDAGHKLRLYDPCSIKMYACNNGTADKKTMVDEYDKVRKDPLKLNFLNRFGSPKEDVVDAFFLTELLQMELKLRKGLIQLKSLTEKQIQIFNRTTKGNPVNILAKDFYERSSNVPKI